MREKKVGLKRRYRGSEWWNEEIRKLTRGKREDYRRLLQRRFEGSREEYEVKRVMRQRERRAKEE